MLDDWRMEQPVVEGLTVPYERAVVAAVPIFTEAVKHAIALFGGTDPKGELRFLAPPGGFCDARMREVYAALPEGLSEDETLGAGLAAAAIACNGEWGSGDAMEEAPTAESTADADATAAAAAQYLGIISSAT